MGQLSRALNANSCDSSSPRSRREPPIVSAARTGQLECAAHLLNYAENSKLR